MMNKNIGCIGLGLLLGHNLGSISGLVMCVGGFLAYYCLFNEIEKLKSNRIFK